MSEESYTTQHHRSRAKFSSEEDELLRSLVSEHGDDNWQIIAMQMNGRNPRQVRERWFKYLKPNLNKKPWTPEEEKLLVEKHEVYGNQWKLIATFFKGRTDINVKSKFHQIERKERKLEKKSLPPQIPVLHLPDDIKTTIETKKKLEDFFNSESYLSDIDLFLTEQNSPFEGIDWL